MTTLVFNSMDAYEAWTEKFENASDYEMIPTAIDDGWKVAVDMFTECKSYKTALRRFEKAFENVNSEINEWFECMRECCESGYFKEIENSYPEGGTYSWGVEETMEGYWYIYLNISGSYAGRERKTA
mgnify:CR=1 FL=1